MRRNASRVRNDMQPARPGHRRVGHTEARPEVVEVSLITHGPWLPVGDLRSFRLRNVPHLLAAPPGRDEPVALGR